MYTKVIALLALFMWTFAFSPQAGAVGVGTLLGTDIHGAAKKGKLKKVVKLVEEKGADVNLKNGSGNTPLEFAAWQGHIKVVNYLLSKDAKIDEQDNAGQTALHLAVTFDRQDVTALLMDRGANLDLKTSDGQTALMRAAINGRGEMIDLLVSQGADTQATDKTGKSALDWAYTLRQDIQSRDVIIAKLSSSMPDTIAGAAQSKFETSQAKPRAQPRSGTSRQSQAAVCNEKDTPDLDENGNKALRYLIRKGLSQSGLGTRDRLCIETLTIRDKIVIRGETVVQYTAGLMFPLGHMTKCLDRRTNQRSDWSTGLDCALGSGVKPQHRGARGTYDGEETL